jgi:diguanylate cyclase (GGDEF)-like protein
MEKILLVEDSKLVAEVMRDKIQSRWNFEILTCQDYTSAKRIAHLHYKDIFLALLDLRLPDAPNGEVVDMVRSLGIPVIVFTGSVDQDTRELMLNKDIIDYVLKRNLNELDYVMRLIQRIYSNRHIHVLIVDDSASSRTVLRKLLQIHQLNIHEAQNAREALTILKSEKKIKLMVIDYRLPDINGDKLIIKIRSQYGIEDLAILGISGHGKGELSAKMLKAGANDFITKPFYTEEFYCRVMQNLEAIERIESIREASFTDFLTGLRNRKYFFENAASLWESARRKHIKLCLAMIDIDHFKKINDAFGHDIGDQALKHVAELLRKITRQSDLLARIGGEEFALILVNPEQKSYQVLDKLRQLIAENPLKKNGSTIQLSISIGATIDMQDSLDKMLKKADHYLYQAKELGRNQTILDGGDKPVLV